MKIAIGSDHAGFHLKEALRHWLETEGHEVTDCGTYSDERTDYPIYGKAVADRVGTETVDFGVLVCGGGQGVCMSANKVHGVRAAVIRTDFDATSTRAHNNANIACFGERVTEPELAIANLKLFLDTPFDGGYHAQRVALIGRIENGEALPVPGC
jgi:ribose 5-phosphate isomerase B